MRVRPLRLLSAGWRRLLAVAAFACLAAIALGFLGGLWRPFDSFSHFRAHLAAFALLLAIPALALRRPAIAAVLLVGAGAVAASLATAIWPERDPAPAGPVYSLLQMNLRWDAADPIEAIRRIAEADADIVTLQEMTAEWRATLEPLESRYPYQVHCLEADGFTGDSAILSRRPFVANSEPVCDEGTSFAEARVDFNGVGVSVASHHQLWPWPAPQWQRFDELRGTLERLPAPVILVGDFNAVAWSAFVQSYAEVLDARVVPGIGPVWAPTFVPDALRRTVGLPLNNVVASPAIGIVETRRMPSTTSDHLPVIVRFTVSRTPADGPAISLAAR